MFNCSECDAGVDLDFFILLILFYSSRTDRTTSSSISASLNLVFSFQKKKEEMRDFEDESERDDDWMDIFIQKCDAI